MPNGVVGGCLLAQRAKNQAGDTRTTAPSAYTHHQRRASSARVVVNQVQKNSAASVSGTTINQNARACAEPASPPASFPASPRCTW